MVRSFHHILYLVSLCSFAITTTVRTTTTSAFQSSSKLLNRNSVRYNGMIDVTTTTRLYANAGDGDDDDDDEAVSLQDDDWRAFRAMLVKGEKTSSTKVKQKPQEVEGQEVIDEEFANDLDGIGSLFDEPTTTSVSTRAPETVEDFMKGMTPLDPSQWAYDSGDIVEPGAVILGGVEQKFGFGLRQQYFHKAAILVLDHDENTFTKGIILNRPTDLFLEDDINEGVKWRVWFGGDVQGLHSTLPDIVCVHSLKTEKATKASIMVMKDIQWTTFENAKKLVKAGVAEPSDFWVFVGYAGWGPRQLAGELERQSWYMVATDSQTLLKELARLSEGADPRGAGLEMWTLLMNMMGRGETAEEYTGDFDDLMLKEWAFKHLLSAASGGGAGKQERSPEGFNYPELVDQLMTKVSTPERKPTSIVEGSILRASGADRSPFLLDNQELHKALVLIIADDKAYSVGVILNRPAAKGLEVKLDSKSGKGTRTVELPLRYGGQYAIKGTEQVLWLHCNSRLRDAGIGSAVGDRNHDGVWKCTMKDVTSAIGQGIASPEDFVVISGVMVWPKRDGMGGQGMDGEVDEGRFEVIPSENVDTVWSALLKQQDVLTNLNLINNLELGNNAWACSTSDQEESRGKENGEQKETPIGGLGEGFDEEDDSFVFKSDVKVSKLSDDALRSWVATFLLGAPTLGN